MALSESETTSRSKLLTYWTLIVIALSRLLTLTVNMVTIIAVIVAALLRLRLSRTSVAYSN